MQLDFSALNRLKTDTPTDPQPTEAVGQSDAPQGFTVQPVYMPSGKAKAKSRSPQQGDTSRMQVRMIEITPDYLSRIDNEHTAQRLAIIQAAEDFYKRHAPARPLSDAEYWEAENSDLQATSNNFGNDKLAMALLLAIHDDLICEAGANS